MKESHRRKIDKFKQRNSMLMSNEKWVKFFTVMMDFPQCEFYYKTIFSEYFVPGGNFQAIEIDKAGLGDCLPSGPIEYELIEAILIPIKAYSVRDSIKVYEYNNSNLAKILINLSNHGIFPLEHVITEQENGITLNNSFIVFDYLILRGYYHLSAPCPPLPRRGPRAKREI